MTKAKKPTTRDTNNQDKKECSEHQWGDPISVYDGDDERYKVRVCRYCETIEYMYTNKSKDQISIV